MRKPSLTASEASPDIAVQVYNAAIHNQMMARLKEGQSIKQVIAWAKDEVGGLHPLTVAGETATWLALHNASASR